MYVVTVSYRKTTQAMTFHDPAGITFTRMDTRCQEHIRTILCAQKEYNTVYSDND